MRQVLLALEVRTASPGAQEGLLDEVLGLIEGADHAVAVDVDLAPVALDQSAEALRCRDHRLHPACVGFRVQRETTPAPKLTGATDPDRDR